MSPRSAGAPSGELRNPFYLLPHPVAQTPASGLTSVPDQREVPAPQTTARQARGVAPATAGGLTPPATAGGVTPSARVGGTTPSATVGGLTPPAVAPIPRPAPSPLVRAFDALPVPAVQARVRGIHDNNEAWLAAYHVVSSARQRVDMSYFILDRDVFGHAMLGQLMRKRRSNIPVNLLLDASGDTFGRTGFTQTLRGQDYLQELVAAGASVSVYNPAHRKVPRQFLHPSSTFGVASNHDKILATERYGMTGGRNIGAEYFSSRSDFERPFRDSDVVVDGPEAAAQLRRAVHVEMERPDINYRIDPDMFGNWVSREGELLGAAAMMDAWLSREPLRQNVRERLRADRSARGPYVEQLLRAVQRDIAQRGVTIDSNGMDNLRTHAFELVGNPDLAGGNRSFRIDTNMVDARVKALDRTSAGAAPHAFDQVEPSVERLIGAARQSIIITNPYIVLSERLRAAFEAAGRRGVRITLLTDGPATADNALTSAYFSREWPRLMARVPNLRVIALSSDQRMHAKTMVFDDEIALIGSSNLDLLSTEINGEIVEVMHSREAAAQLTETFRRDLDDPRAGAREYTIARDRDGQPVLRDGRPIVTSGPDDLATGPMLAQELLWKPLSHILEAFPQARSIRDPGPVVLPRLRRRPAPEPARRAD